MAELSIQSAISIRLTTQEFRIVSKALRGKLKPEDIEEAKALGESLSISKATQIKQSAAEADKLLANIEKNTKEEQPQ